MGLLLCKRRARALVLFFCLLFINRIQYTRHTIGENTFIEYYWFGGVLLFFFSYVDATRLGGGRYDFFNDFVRPPPQRACTSIIVPDYSRSPYLLYDRTYTQCILDDLIYVFCIIF